MINEDPAAAAFLAQLSSDVSSAQSGDDVDVVVERAVEMVTPCEHASVTIRQSRDRLTTVAATSSVAREADALQYALGEGPCIDVATFDEVRLMSTTVDDARWPVWGRAVSGLGLNAVLSVPLGSPDTQFGALNLYASRERSFTTDDLDLAVSLAAIAGNALHASRQVDTLETALHSRHLIGVAQGILMSRYEIDLDQAFALLQRYSNHANIKLRIIAAHVVEHRRLPDAADPVTTTPDDPTR